MSRAAGVVVIESAGLLHARLISGLRRLVPIAVLNSSQGTSSTTDAQIPENMMGRLLDDGDLRKLQRMLIEKKPPVPSVRRRTTAKVGWANHAPPQG
jgi:hypothetical protein